MGYGWLTESSLIPKKSQKIAVDDSSLLDIQVLIAKKKAEREAKRRSRKEIKEIKIKPFNFKNDNEEENKEEEDPQRLIDIQNEKKQIELLQESRETLKLKSELYDKLKQQETNELTKERFLLDFDRKKTEDYMRTQEYKKDKEEFYEEMRKSKMRETERFNFKAPGHLELSRRLHDMEKERQAWEREAIDDIDKEFDDLGNLRKRFFIKQSYDKTMTKKDVETLEEVVESEKKEKDRIRLIKEKREEAKRKRIEKLKKLKVV